MSFENILKIFPTTKSSSFMITFTSRDVNATKMFTTTEELASWIASSEGQELWAQLEAQPNWSWRGVAVTQEGSMATHWKGYSVWGDTKWERLDITV